MTQYFSSPAELADAVIGIVGPRVVLALPVGLGKAVHLANALYARAATDATIQLTIFTALTLEKPRARNELERRLLEPIVERLFADWPPLAYAEALRRQALPANIDVREFYFRPASYLGNALAQRSYTSLNYTQVAGELLDLGINVIGQLVAPHPLGAAKYSLSSNPEVTLDLLPELDARRAAGKPYVFAGQVNSHLPYMVGDAELQAVRFDFVLDSPACNFPLFGLPNRAVSHTDYATGMHVASLVPDGGTLQLGIGSLSDAVAHCLKLRHLSPDVFNEVLDRLPGGPQSGRRPALPLESQPFQQGLYVSAELLSDATYSLFDAGIVKRSADDDGAIFIHAGFFVGSNALYQSLRELPEEQRKKIAMTRISFVNSLYGDEHRKRRQRRNARFINEIMMVTLLGAAVSDALEDGRVISGVGGQFDFVRMAHALDDSHSILMLSSRRVHNGVPRSNIVWNYGHNTVPRHYRDIYVCEYGIAATRGLPDAQIVASLLGIADSAFQASLLKSVKRFEKIAPNYEIPTSAMANSPDAVRQAFAAADIAAYFPTYPLGTDLTPVEQRLAAALGCLKDATVRPLQRVRTVASALLRGSTAEHSDALARLDLKKPNNLREYVLQQLVSYALDKEST